MNVSVIVPIYGVDKYLEKFLDCLLSQNIQSAEFILINDASEDNCSIIIERYLHDKRIVYLNKKVNEGLYKARQDGYDISTGDYVINVDPDDILSPNFLDDLYQMAKQNSLDIVVSNILLIDDNGNDIHSKKSNYHKENIIFDDKNIAEILGLPYATWCRMFKRELIDKFGYKYRQGELFLSSFHFVKNVKSGLNSKATYYYRQRTDSMSAVNNSSKRLSNSISEESLLTTLENDLAFEAFIADKDAFKLYKFINVAKLIFVSCISNGDLTTYKKHISIIKKGYSINKVNLFCKIKYLNFETKIFTGLIICGLSSLFLAIRYRMSK
ncbi:glycosyltransferase family 2 protein [Shewanella sp. MEBiC00475]|uniref:glycosyltransferase family 2 protein n=1 Tax=Shewanella sp. MEBiC00475 TaxID=2575361 RepID=UPI0015869177|nr:glycosyltransferase family 2 protein [Shewanella sp. MEBiC00475]